MIDSAGNEQLPTVVRFGATTSTGFAQTTQTTNIPVKVILRFNGVEPDVNRRASLAVSLEWTSYNGGVEKAQIEFRNIPLHYMAHAPFRFAD